jgi:hypothetical protein
MARSGKRADLPVICCRVPWQMPRQILPSDTIESVQKFWKFLFKKKKLGLAYEKTKSLYAQA